jgi:NAD-dependent DNA ligase
MEHTLDYPALPKTQVVDNDLMSAAKKWLKDTLGPNYNNANYYINLKYDGSGLRCYYKDGKLQKVLGAPDEKFGILRTDTLSCLFPQELDDKSIESLGGELIVDASKFGYGSRNKANGLTNSKNIIEDIKKYAMVRVYRVTYHDTNEYDYDRLCDTLEELPILRDDEKIYFMAAEPMLLGEVSDVKSICHTEYDSNVQCDGIVVYTRKGFRAFKFYYNEIVEATIKDITYRKQKTGNWYPTLHFDTIKVDGKNVSKCAGGSLRIIKERGIGIGSKVGIIMSNSTIPKVLKVYEPSYVFNEPN